MVSSVYIHIPFCDKICSYCDFPKFCYYEKWIDKYLQSLEYEIKTNYKNDLLKTIYIGGGTPSSLKIKELIKLFEILKMFKLDNDYEFTFECNINHINEELLKLLIHNGINRISIGIESFNEDILTYLNRNTNTNIDDKISLVKKYFDNINIDLMYAIPSQTKDMLKQDLEHFIKLDINHISCYSLIIENGTVLHNNKVKPIDQELDLEMYNIINEILHEHKYKHYEVSNYAKENYESRHNLVYWNNDNYYGFGLGASGYIENIRYTNTLNLTKYMNKDYNRNIETIDESLQMEYEMILGLRKMDGISKKNFKEKYHKEIKEVYDINKLLEEEKLLENDEYVYINPKNIYTSNDILVNFIGEL